MKQLPTILKYCGLILLYYFAANAAAYLFYAGLSFIIQGNFEFGLENSNVILVGIMYVLSIVLIPLFFKQNRPAFVNAFKKSFGNILFKSFVGLVFTALFLAILYGILFLISDIHFSVKGEKFPVLLQWFFMLYFAAMLEEVICRNLMLDRLIYEKNLHPLMVLFTSSLLFSLLHLFNDNFSFLPFINIILVGIIFGIIYLKYRNIYLVTAIHFSWNYLTGLVLGSHVSGIKMPSIFTYEISSNKIISGGEFGIEGSLVLVILQILVIIFYLPFLKKINNEYLQKPITTEITQG